MSNKNLTTQIVDTFKANPTEDKLLVTSDGNCFFPKDKSSAEYHARVAKLKLMEVSREEYAAELDEKETPEPKTGSEAGTGTEGTEGGDKKSKKK